MYSFLLSIHSWLRYVVLLFIIIALIKGIAGWAAKKPFTNGDRKVALFALISSHIQLLIGLILYFISPIASAARSDFGAAMKDDGLRFWAVEHITGMIIAIVLVTIGYSKAKKAVNMPAGHRKITVFFLIALILIFATIPWPFMNPARPLF